MILPFSTKWPEHMGSLSGTKTGFTDKIVKGIWEHHPQEMFYFTLQNPLPLSYRVFDSYEPQKYSKLIPKIHTLREDQKDRWNTGIIIDYFINCRTKKMYRFAPRLPVVSTQDVFMTMIHGRFEITVDDTFLYYPDKLKLAQNDGFDSVEDFARFFFPDAGKTKYEASLKLIHWTNFKY